MLPNSPGAGARPAYSPAERSGAVPINLQSEVADLKTRVEQQNLLLQTLLRVLLAKGTIEKQEFARWMEQVDELDGVRDGRLGKERGTKQCPACNRTNTLKAMRCQYCGADFPAAEFLSHEEGNDLG